MGTNEALTDGMHEIAVTMKANGQRLVQRRLEPALGGDAALVERWLAIAALNARLVHPACARVAEWGTDADGPFLTSCAHAGVPLRSVLRQEASAAQDVALAVLVACMLLEVCEAARDVDARLVHLDLDPNEVLVRPSGTLVVPEFGFWGVLSPRDRAQRRLASGRVRYASPELIKAQAVDAQSDVFSVGVVLCELLSGRHPFDAATPLAVALAVADGPRPSLATLAPAAPSALRDVIDVMLAVDPGDRFQSPGAARAALKGAEPSADHARSRLTARVDGARRTAQSVDVRMVRMDEPRTALPRTRPARNERTRLGFAVGAVVEGPKKSAVGARVEARTPAHVPVAPPPLMDACASDRSPRVSALPLGSEGTWAHADRFARPSRPAPGTPAWRDPSATVFRRSLDFTAPAAMPVQPSPRERILWGFLFGLPILLIVYFSCRLAL